MDQAIKALEDYWTGKKKGLLGVVAGTSEDVKLTAQQLAPKDLGDLREQIRSTIIEKKDMITGDVLSAAPYSAYVEFGTKPHRPPYSALEGWSERHGIPTGAVVTKIAKYGTPAQPFMTPASEKGRSEFRSGVIAVMSS